MEAPLQSTNNRIHPGTWRLPLRMYDVDNSRVLWSWVSVEFLHAPLPRKGSGTTTTMIVDVKVFSQKDII